VKTARINLIIGLSIFCLAAILVVQGFWLQQAAQNNRAAFDVAVNEALNQAVAKMEKRNVFRVFSRYTSTDSIDEIINNSHNIVNIIKQDSAIEIKEFTNDSTYKNITHKTQVMVFDTKGAAKEWEKRLDSIVGDILVDLRNDTLQTSGNYTFTELDSSIATALQQKGITNSFEYGVADDKGKLLYSSAGFNNNILTAGYAINLLPLSVGYIKNTLHVQVQNREGYILKSLLPFMVAMLVFTIIIVLTFGISIRTILKQKKLSTIKNDFINNMTHEFKTPIATINIAADALHSEGISTAQTQHFADIIKQESRSMNQKVETILQMALVEQQQVQLEKETIGANPLVQKTIQHLQLSLEASAAQLNVNYLPNDVNLCIDAHHVGNVLGNIIDNAIKYSQGAPHISIALAATNTMLTISIADKGIGMSKEEQKHVFDKFYRAQSGNIHNTKGFGLGLSYAREIVLLHKGQISIESEKGEGTTVTITLPIHGHNG
jgi:two-component system, OmpR family, phosphate regulon sensor histidine kinase PhoR